MIAMAQDMRLLLSRAARSATLYFKERAAERDLSVVQAQALIEIDQHPGISLGGLAACLSKDLASTSILIDRMARLRLVRRETDPRDRRRNRLFVTEQALPAVLHVESAREDVNHLVLSLMGPEQAGHLASLLSRFLDALARSEAAVADDHEA